MLIFVLFFLALSAHCRHNSYNPSRLQKQIMASLPCFLQLSGVHKWLACEL
jgi:hypothetical protein